MRTQTLALPALALRKTTFKLCGDRRLAARAEKGATPVADSNYRFRVYARHEHAMAWSHGQRGASGGGDDLHSCLNVSINKALSSKGHWRQIPNLESLERFEDWTDHAPISVVQLEDPPPLQLRCEVAGPSVETVKEVATTQRVTKEVAVPVATERLKEVQTTKVPPRSQGQGETASACPAATCCRRC